MCYERGRAEATRHVAPRSHSRFPLALANRLNDLFRSDMSQVGVGRGQFAIRRFVVFSGVVLAVSRTIRGL